jgi:hypothetical protein
MQLLTVTVTPKYFNFTTQSKDLSDIYKAAIPTKQTQFDIIYMEKNPTLTLLSETD